MGGWVQNMFDYRLSTNYNGQVIIQFVTLNERFIEDDIEKQQHISLRSETILIHTATDTYINYYSVYSRCQTLSTIKFQIASTKLYHTKNQIAFYPPCVRLP